MLNIGIIANQAKRLSREERLKVTTQLIITNNYKLTKTKVNTKKRRLE